MQIISKQAISQFKPFKAFKKNNNFNFEMHTTRDLCLIFKIN